MISIALTTEERTRRLGFCLGARLRPADVVLLSGELGVGKSVLARAVAHAMGVVGPVTSPTFTILNVHEGREMKCYHFDLYRISGAHELYELGLLDYLPACDGVSLVEWPERAWDALPPCALAIELRVGDDTQSRLARISSLGGFDEGRLANLAEEMAYEYPHD